ncbi:MAG: hypothetical protein ABW022_23590 [Actinoplanes sp.]
MADEQERPPDARSAREQARKLAEAGDYAGAQAWALISIAEDVASLRRDSDWTRRHTSVTRG